MKHLHRKVMLLTHFWTCSTKFTSLLQLLFQVEMLLKYLHAPALMISGLEVRGYFPF